MGTRKWCRARFDPWRDREAPVERLLVARDDGATLREAAAAAGVHVATVCRWARRCPTLAEALADSAQWARRRRYASRPRPERRPRVPCHPRCPECGAGVEVRGVCGLWPHFWRCARWPACRWASWQPRHPQDCPACGGPRFWAHSRKSVRCPTCGARTPADPAGVPAPRQGGPAVPPDSSEAAGGPARQRKPS
jgi:ferredoxin